MYREKSTDARRATDAPASHPLVCRSLPLAPPLVLSSPTPAPSLCPFSFSYGYGTQIDGASMLQIGISVILIC